MKVLDTDRLSLRHLDLSDAPFILALLNDPGWIATSATAASVTVYAFSPA
jgi:hypothetical protein